MSRSLYELSPSDVQSPEPGLVYSPASWLSDGEEHVAHLWFHYDVWIVMCELQRAGK
ncbi:hypothetical protein ABWJ26_000440 [Vibrio fluvialis]